MTSRSPIPLWAVLSIGVALLGGIYISVQLTVAQPKVGAVVGQATVSARPSMSVPVTSTVVTPIPSVSTETIPSGWKIYKNFEYHFQFRYPRDWIDMKRDIKIQDYFVKTPMVDVLDLQLLKEAGTPEEIVSREIQKRHCVDENNSHFDRIIRHDNNGTLFVQYCSATTETYNYLFSAPLGTVELSYHDDFLQESSEAKKLDVFNKIIESIKTY
jgi:hypothetical protein